MARKHGVSEATLYNWKSKYGGLEVSETKRLCALEAENAQLKKLLADTILNNAGLEALLSKSGNAVRITGSSATSSVAAQYQRAACVQGH